MARKRSNRQQGGRVNVSGEEVEAPYGLNEVDDFASKRERVLLNESSMGDFQEEEELVPDEEEEEVLAMNNEESSSEEEEEDGEEEQGEEEDDEMEEGYDGEKAYRKVFGRKLHLGDDSAEHEEGQMLDNENAWGSTKGDYYGADDLADDHAAKEIEKEALRQKRKHLEEMNMNDYLDDEIDEEWSKEAKSFDTGEFKQSTKQNKETIAFKDILNMDSDAKKEYLNTLFPEFVPLSNELSKLSPVLEKLRKEKETEITSVKKMALSSYLGVLSCYFGIFLHESQNNEEFSTMKDHPVMEMLLTAKEVWRQANNLPEDMELDNDIQIDGLLDDALTPDEELGEFDAVKMRAMELNDANNDSGNHKENLSNEKGRESEKEDDEEAEEEEEEDEEDEEDEEVDLDDFEDYVTLPRVNKKQSNIEENQKLLNDSVVDDYVESEIADVDAQDKKARRRTLRFYTSKIDQQENKKVDRFKGDDDIPYKERLFERQQRLIEEARKRGLHDKNGEDLDSKDYGSDDEATSKLINNDNEKDYFNLIQKSKQNKKDVRRQTHSAAVKAAKDGKLAELAETLGDDGKRAINYQILKNKGLTPRRKKDNRNSRVKKRKKFEKAQKKLKSVRAVYSGGQNGVYEGEKTGIKKNLVKSVKFKM